MVNKVVSLNEMIVHLGPPVWRCRGPLYKVVWQPVFTTALTASSILTTISTATSTGPQLHTRLLPQGWKRALKSNTNRGGKGLHRRYMSPGCLKVSIDLFYKVVLSY